MQVKVRFESRGNHWRGGWVSHTAGLHTMERRQICVLGSPAWPDYH